MKNKSRIAIITAVAVILALSVGVVTIQGATLDTDPVSESLVFPASPATFAITPTTILPAQFGVQAVDPTGLQRLIAETGAKVSIAPQTGAARFIRWSANDAQQLSARLAAGTSAEAQANAFFREYGSVFGSSNVVADLQLEETRIDNLGTTRLRYSQVYQGVPVFAGSLRVHLNANGSMRAVNGIVIPKIGINTTPSLDSAMASDIAVRHVSRAIALDVETPRDRQPDLSAKNSKLYVFRAGLLKGVVGPNHLVYEVEVVADVSVREFVYVDAHTGEIVDQITGIQGDITRRVYEGGYGSEFEVWAEEDGPYLGDDPDIQNIINFTEDSYNLFANLSGGAYLSYDGNDARMEIVNNDPRINCPNANWNGVSTNYCTDVTGDDTVAHEWTHAYTEKTHGLIYQWQSGALNESYSDIFGEVVDFINGAGLDSPATLRTVGACSVYQASFPSVLQVNSPANIADLYEAGSAAFGPPLDATGVTGDLVIADDGDDEDGEASTTDGCQAITNTTAISGSIAVIDRGTCAFTVKVKNAQDAGAIGALIVNHATGGDGVTTMSGNDDSITIPSIFIGKSNGDTIKAELPGVNATLKLDTGSVLPDDSYRWLSGEDDPAFNGAIRDMWSPECFSDPGKVSANEYHCSTDDAGGVHTNSGVPNHAFALLVDGGTYNGQAIQSIGLTKAAHIYWRSMTTYQHEATDFPDHADALEASCTDLIGVNLTDLSTGQPSGQIISQTDCEQLTKVALAVEFNTPPTQCNFQPLLTANAPALCSAGAVTTVFSDTFEADVSAWSLSNEGVYEEYRSSNWALDSSLPADRSGAAFFAIDSTDIGDCSPGSDDQSGVKYLDSPVITIPTTIPVARLAFDHYVATEALWDGGNVWVKVNDGDWQLIESTAFEFNAYNESLETASAGNTNPLAGQAAFTGSDGGSLVSTWGQSQVDLSAYASRGDTVQLRFAFGVDGCNGLDGWYVDNVELYACAAEATPEADITLANGASSLGSTQGAGSVMTQTFSIENVGLAELTWTISEDAARPAPVTRPGGWSANVQRQTNPDAISIPNRVSVPLANNVVQDGGFEAGSPNPFWTESATTFFSPICDPVNCGPLAYEGDWYAWFGGWGALHVSAVTQTVTITNSGTAELSFWVVTGGVTGADIMTVSIDNTAVYTVDINNANDFSTDYVQVTVDVSSFADGNNHVVSFAGSTVGNIFVDNIVLNDDVPCLVPEDVPWLSVSPTSGTTAAGQSSEVMVNFDATALNDGTYNGFLCVSTNDANQSLLKIPVNLVADPIPTWNQTVMINSTLYTDTMTFPGLESTDIITLVDHIAISSTETVSFSLRYGWTESLQIDSYDVSPPEFMSGPMGSVLLLGDRQQEWQVISATTSTQFVITRTFSVTPGEWRVDRISERLSVGRASTQPDSIVFTFIHPIKIYMPLVAKQP